MKSCTGRFHDHNSCLECAFLKRTIQFFGQINAFQQAEKREICENNVVVDVTVFVFTNISESNSTLLDVQQLPAFIGCCRRVDDLILVTALIGYQIKRILENFLAFLFCFFLPFLCGLKVGFRSFLGLTCQRVLASVALFLVSARENAARSPLSWAVVREGMTSGSSQSNVSGRSKNVLLRMIGTVESRGGRTPP